MPEVAGTQEPTPVFAGTLAGRRCRRTSIFIEQESRAVVDVVGRETKLNLGAVSWGGSVEVFREMGSPLSYGLTVPYEGLIEDRRPPQGRNPLRWCRGDVCIRELEVESDGLLIQVDGLGLPQRALPPWLYEPRRLVGAALGEFECGGDPVPDLFNALIELLPEGEIRTAVELLSLRRAMEDSYSCDSSGFNDGGGLERA
jgi:hypothetical protein